MAKLTKKATDPVAGLRKCLEQIQQVLAGRIYLGGREVETAQHLERRLRSRIDLEPIEKLENEAHAFADLYLPQIEKSRAGLRQRELENEAASTQHGEALKKMFAEQEASRLARLEAKQQLG